MRPDRIEVVEDRLRLLERRVELIEHGLGSVEAGVTHPSAGPDPQPAGPPPMPPGAMPVPPPIMAREPDPFRRLNAVYASPVQGSAVQDRTDRDTEYMIGAKLLPKLGAGLVLLGVLFFVAWGYSAGWITPWMVFSGEILFCSIFVVVGQWKRNEREQYGQILTGIGSCGLYLSLAGGQIVQNLFSGEVLVAGFMALSFANLFYGLWSQSRAFLAIGIIGGFAGALLPMKHDKTTLNAILHLAILAPAAFIAAKRKWADMAAWLWLASTLALMPLLTSPIDWVMPVVVLYLASLGSVAAYASAAETNPFDPEALFGPIMLFVTGLIGFGVEHNRMGAVHLVLLGIGSTVVAMATKGCVARQRLVLGAIAIPALIGPFCFSTVECVGILTGLAIAASAIACFWKSRAAVGIAGAEFVLAVCSYLVIQSFDPFAHASEAWLLAGMIAAAIAVACVGFKLGGSAEALTIGVMALILPLFGRIAVVTITGSGLSPSPELSAAEALAFFALGAIVLTARTRWMSAIAAMWASFAIALLAYIYAVSFGVVPKTHDAGLLIVLALTAAVGVPVATGTAAADFKKSITAMAGIVIGFLAMRLSFVLATMSQVRVDAILAVALTGAFYSVAASITALSKKSEPYVAVAWVLFAACGATYVTAPVGSIRLSTEMAIVSGLFAALVAASAALVTKARRQVELWHVVAILGWIVFSRWVDVTLTWSGTNLHNVSSLTVAWIVYALALLSLGFWLKARELRYWSFAVMFATVSKILLVDLAYTDVPFRVGVLLGLGLLMLGGGYWYIKGRGGAGALGR